MNYTNYAIEVGDLVATTRELANRNRPAAPLPAGTAGIVTDAGPTYIRLEIYDRCIHVRPDTLEILEKGFLTTNVALADSPNLADVWDLWAETARTLHEMNVRLTCLIDGTRAEPRLARPGL